MPTPAHNFKQVLLRSFEVAKNALRVFIVNDSSTPFAVTAGAENILITNIISPAINTELNKSLSGNLKKIIVRSRKLTTIRIAFTPNGTADSGAGANKYIEIPEGGYLSLDPLNFTGKTLYYRTDKARTIEITELF